jgi:hypothetical protein
VAHHKAWIKDAAEATVTDSRSSSFAAGVVAGQLHHQPRVPCKPLACGPSGCPRRSNIDHLMELNLIEATAYHQTACFEAGVLFARAEGIVPAPEANHARSSRRCAARSKGTARSSCSTCAATATST